jgi:hypothetical protein
MLTVKGCAHDPFFTLENPIRRSSYDSRIDAGSYQCEPFSGAKYKNVYVIKDVPDRSDILIHWGNFEEDTLGCVLIGNSAGIIGGRPAVTDSKAAFKRFTYIIGDEGFDLTIV